MRSIARYGWKNSLPDPRDKVADVTGLSPANEVDPRADMPPVYDQGQLGSCFDPETEILTDTGWKHFPELTEHDRVATVDPKTNELFYEFPTHLFKIWHDGELIVGNQQFLDFKVTPDHKMLVRRWNEHDRSLNSHYEFIEAKNLGWYSGLMNRITWNGDENASDTYILPGVEHKHKPQRSDYAMSMRLWLRFLGIYLAEGTMLKRSQQRDRISYKIQLAASKDREKDFIRQLLSDMEIHGLELEDRFTLSNKRVFEALASLGLEGVKAGKKFVPEFVFSQDAEMISEFLLGHFMGDGCEDMNRAHYTSSSQLAIDLQRLIFLSGNESHVAVRESRVSVMKDGRSVKGTLPEHRISVCEKTTRSVDRQKHITREEYRGPVYCAEVPTYHTLVTRRNGQILISGNCTSNAIAGAMQYDMHVDGAAFALHRPSRLMLYYQERMIEGSLGKGDTGAFGRDGFKALTNYGWVPEREWPYHINRYAVDPPNPLWSEAGTRKLTKPYAVVPQDEDSIVAVLSNKQTIAFGFSVFESFESTQTLKSGIVPMPLRNESMLGGHEMLMVGYLESQPEYVLCRNSWSSQIYLGLQGADVVGGGYLLMPWEMINDPNITGDLRTIVRGS